MRPLTCGALIAATAGCGQAFKPETWVHGLRVLGGPALEHATCETLGDHRLAMGLAVAGLAGALGDGPLSRGRQSGPGV